MDTRFLQCATALTAFVFGVAAILYTRFVFLDEEPHPLVVTILAGWFVLVVAIATAAIVDTRVGSVAARAVLWAASVVFLLGSTAMITTIGWLFLPAAIFGVVSAFLSGPTPTTAESPPG